MNGNFHRKEYSPYESIIAQMIKCCEELGEHNTPMCTCRDGNLAELKERVRAERIRRAIKK